MWEAKGGRTGVVWVDEVERTDAGGDRTTGRSIFLGDLCWRW